MQKNAKYAKNQWLLDMQKNAKKLHLHFFPPPTLANGGQPDKDKGKRSSKTVLQGTPETLRLQNVAAFAIVGRRLTKPEDRRRIHPLTHQPLQKVWPS